MSQKIEIELVKATKKDFVKYAGQVQATTKQGLKHNVSKYVPRHGMPYWLINSKGNIEPVNYIFTENTDIETFKLYLLKEQVLILKQFEE